MISLIFSKPCRWSYITSYVYLQCKSWLLGSSRPDCTSSNLRATNVILALLSFTLLYKIQTAHEKQSSWRNTLVGLNITLFPISFFFNFLYYTDTGSLTCVILMYWLGATIHRPVLSSIVSATFYFLWWYYKYMLHHFGMPPLDSCEHTPSELISWKVDTEQKMNLI